MDPPEHREHRHLASPWFKPRTIRRMEERVTEVCRELLDRLASGGREAECDFVAAVAAPAPLKMIAELLGVPEQDEPVLLRLTNELFGAQDPEFQRQGADAQQTFTAMAAEIFGYFSGLFEARKREPGHDLLSVMAQGRIRGEPVSVLDAVSFCFVIATAGHETTRNAISGGLLALMQHPGEWKRLREDARLLDTAVDEILRWTSPVIHFARTATADTELRGRRIAEGETVAMFYPSANRDEDGLRGTGQLPRGPRAEPAPRLRHRRALLPRDTARPARAPHPVRPAALTPRRGAARRPPGTPPRQPGRRLEAPPHPLSPAGLTAVRRPVPSSGRRRPVPAQAHTPTLAPEQGPVSGGLFDAPASP